MSAKTCTIHEEKGQITLIELHTLSNCLPVNTDTYLRILHGLAMSGCVKLPVNTKAS
jgi:hypothetical protein